MLPARGRRKCFVRIEDEQLLNNKPATANQIATMRHEHTDLVLEDHYAWIFEEEGEEGPLLNPYKKEFFEGDEQTNPIANAFKASKQCRRVLLDRFKLPDDNCEDLAEAIVAGKARAISDGSYRPEEETGTSGFIITQGKTTKNALKGCNWVPGLPHEQSPYRSELAGINGVLACLKIIVEKFNITEGSIEIGLDGEAAKDQVEDNNFLKILQPSFDILVDIRERIKDLPIDIKWR